MWILLIIYHFTMGNGAALTTADFGSKQACEAAKLRLESQFNSSLKLKRNDRVVDAYCFSSGDPN